MVRRSPALAERTRIARMGRPPKPVDESTYAGRLAARLRALREDSGLTVAQAREALERAGVSVTEETVRSWERAASAPPVLTVPVLAAIYGVAPGEVLPPE